jgi:hypothetical protein
MTRSVPDFLRDMARQHIAAWRDAKRNRLPRTAAWARGVALIYLARARAYERRA